jgi:integrase
MARKGTGRRAKGEGAYWTDGKRHFYRYKGKTVADADRSRAAAKLEELKRDLDKKLDKQGSKQTLRTFLAYWLEAVVLPDVSESTHNNYRWRIEMDITPTLGDYRLFELEGNVKLIRAWLNALREVRPFSSAKQARAILERALDVAVEEHYIKENPAASVKPPKAPRASDDTDEEEGHRTLTPEMVDRILADVKARDQHQVSHLDRRFNQSAGMFVLYSLAFALGFRRGELLGLRRKDVDLEAGIIKVRQQVIRLDGNHKISDRLKTKAARRELPLVPAIVSLLRPHLLRTAPGENSLLFPAKDGGPLNPSVVTKHFARVCKRLGLTGYTFHDSRHSAITRWREAGIDIEVVAALAGHEEVKTSAQTYSDPHMERRRAAVERIS